MNTNRLLRTAMGRTGLWWCLGLALVVSIAPNVLLAADWYAIFPQENMFQCI